MKDAHEKQINQSVPKLIQLMACLAESRMPLRLQEIAVRAGLPQATVLRYLNALMQEGYAFQDRLSGRYALTWRICGMGDAVRTHLSLRTLSLDLINDLPALLETGICLVVEHERQCMYLDCIYEPATMGQTLQRIGKQTPMHATSSGKLLLTNYTGEELTQLVEEKGLPQLTGKTITTQPRLEQELEQVRRQGYAVDDEECEAGLRCVAVPVRDFTGKVAAAISAFGSVRRLTQAEIEGRILPALRAAAGELSFRMGGRRDTDEESPA